MMTRERLANYAFKIENELKDNLLPFWIKYGKDNVNGGFYGGISNRCNGVAHENKSLVQHTRFLWNYSHAYLCYKDDRYLTMADYAFDYIINFFWDKRHGGNFWMLDYKNKVIADTKKVYGQAFSIYAFTEYYRATANKSALDKSMAIFEYLQTKAFDNVYSGYSESLSSDWEIIPEPLSGLRELKGTKSMNTTIHLMEAFTNLIRVTGDDKVISAQIGLIDVLLNKVIDQESNHQRLFFNNDWVSLSQSVSYGHDIETSWLLSEAAHVLKDQRLISKTGEVAIKMVDATLDAGMDVDGSLFYEGDLFGVYDFRKIWWPQAEALVGFLNAWQLSGKEIYLNAFFKVWDFIETYLVDRKYGEWFQILKRDAKPDLRHLKGNNWKTPYHNTRACFESIHRISDILEKSCKV